MKTTGITIVAHTLLTLTGMTITGRYFEVSPPA